MIFVSACLVGIKCRWDGKSNKREIIRRYYRKGYLLALCPEVIGGLSIPREKCELKGGDGDRVLEKKAKVISRTGVERTPFYLAGAFMVLQQINKANISIAILKDRSPSCGPEHIYDGTFKNRLIIGKGVLAALLNKNKILIYNADKLTVRQIKCLVLKNSNQDL